MLKKTKPTKKAKQVKATVFKEVQETFVVRQGKYNKTMSGFWLDFPMEAKEQVVASIKEDGLTPVKTVQLGHNKIMYFFPMKLSKTKKTDIRKGMVMKLVTKHFPYSSVAFVRNNGLVEIKKIVEVEGKRAVKVKKDASQSKTKVAKKTVKKAKRK